MKLALSLTVVSPVLEIVALAWSCFGLWAKSDTSSQLAGLVILSGISAIFYQDCFRACVRMSMVAARFSLDSLPLKQMATEPRLLSGQIDATTKSLHNSALLASVDRLGMLDGLSGLSRTIMRFMLPQNDNTIDSSDYYAIVTRASQSSISKLHYVPRNGTYHNLIQSVLIYARLLRMRDRVRLDQSSHTDSLELS